MSRKLLPAHPNTDLEVIAAAIQDGGGCQKSNSVGSREERSAQANSPAVIASSQSTHAALAGQQPNVSGSSGSWGEYATPTEHPRHPDTMMDTISLSIVDGWFASADADGDGRIGGSEAVPFFARTGLEPAVLKKVRIRGPLYMQLA